MSEDGSGRADGYVYARRHRDRAAYRWSVDVTAYVREDARGRGVGKRLYTRLFEVLPQLGYHQAFAGIALPNAASVALHEAVGFAPLGVYRQVGFKLGAWHDVGWWQRALQASRPPVEPIAFAAFVHEGGWILNDLAWQNPLRRSRAGGNPAASDDG